MSSNEIKKELRIAGKGHNETLEIVNSMERILGLDVAVKYHVPENGGT
jgi:hypothetical protein